MNRLEAAAEAIAKSILCCDNVHVISHNDADGITSAGLLCNSLIRAGIPFQATLLNRLDASVLDRIQGPIVLCDMGSGNPDLISRIKEKCFVLDHHKPMGALKCMHLNPHQYGIDGALEMSASGTVYSVVRHMGDNKDLAGLALVGAMGDRQAMIGVNKAILDEAVEAKAVIVKSGIKMSEDGPIEHVLTKSIEPLLDFTGQSEMVQEFLCSLGIKGNIEDLAGENLFKLSTALTLRLLMQGSFAADSVIGEVIRLEKEVVANSLELVQLLNACGNRDVPGLGLTLCLRDRRALSEARRLAIEYKNYILKEIEILKKERKELKNIRYLLIENMEAGAVVCSLGIRYLFTDKPLLILNRKHNEVKVSARGNKPLIAKGLDLSVALRGAAGAVNGVGGGHNIASGASIIPGMEEKFLSIVDEVIGVQLSGRGLG
jgi:single-stranded-DNA-specific exonuclease